MTTWMRFELPVATSASRVALTLPDTGPGILTWGWRTDLPEDTFRLHLCAIRVHRFRLPHLLGQSPAGAQPIRLSLVLIDDGIYQRLELGTTTDGWLVYGVSISAGTHTIRWTPNFGSVMTLDQVTFTPGDGCVIWAQAHFTAGQSAAPP